VARACAAKAKEFAHFAHHVVENSLKRPEPTEETLFGMDSLSTLMKNAAEDTDNTTSIMELSFAANKDKYFEP
jgi:hypothetical protein